jgi:DNA mismatch endonuclease (patch repair protein)
MARIRGRDTTPEVLLRNALWHNGVRYRKNLRVLGIRPDIVFVKAKLAVFVDGCFWHGCPEHYVRPRSSNPAFWAAKLATNTERDERQMNRLEADGWRVIRVWEHQVRSGLKNVVQLITHTLSGGDPPDNEHWVVIKVEPTSQPDIESNTQKELRSGKFRLVPRYRPPFVSQRKRNNSKNLP